MRGRTMRLAGVGTAAGIFSGLFGVGGGTVIVPGLVLFMGYEQREATGTSLAAIVIIASVAALFHGLYGNVDVGKAALIGVPAVVGVLAGTWLQQRVPRDVISIAFAILLVLVAADMVL